MQKEGSPVINEFLQRYARELDFFQQVATICGAQLERLLIENGIRAIVTWRAKKLDSLRRKLEDRNKNNMYTSVEHIYSDIVDLAGVRVALYFPADREEVGKIITSNFANSRPKLFDGKSPKNTQRFKGYLATHYRVYLKEVSLPKENARYSSTIVEIQVASLLMHSWAEVEHDLVYKPNSGDVSVEELNILDNLNGLITVGEGMLEDLQKAVRKRTQQPDSEFSNHYELAQFLYSELQKTDSVQESDLYMGRADVLLNFLELSHKNSPRKIQPFLSFLDGSSASKAISEQLIDLILQVHPSLYTQATIARAMASERSPYDTSEEKFLAQEPTARFLKAWIALETLARKIYSESFPNEGRYLPLDKMLGAIILSDETRDSLRKIQHLRNEFVHGITIPDSDSLISATEYIEKFVKQISNTSRKSGRRLKRRPKK